MKTYEVAVAWGIAICVVLGFLATVFLWEFDKVSWCDNTDKLDDKNIVIGSSLSRAAFAASNLKDNGSSEIIVFWNGGLKAEDGFQQLECALENGASNIFIEANTFAFMRQDYAKPLDFVFRTFTRKVKNMLGRVLPHNENNLKTYRSNYVWDGFWPLHGKPGSLEVAIHNTWAGPLRMLGKQEATMIALFEPPLTDWKSHSRALSLDYEVEILELADSSHLPLVAIWSVWESKYFYDANSHLNLAGSIKFQDEFWHALDKLAHAK